MAKYYAQINGQANVATNFNPYPVYTGSNNYLRVEFNNDFTTNATSACYLFKTSSNWFSFEQGSYGQYFNIGSTTYFGGASATNKHYWNTSGFDQTAILTLNNGSGTIVMGEQTVSGTYGGNLPNSNLAFFSNSTSLKADFYEYKVYGSGETPVFDFVPYISGSTKGIYDKVNGQFFSAQTQTAMTLVKMSSLETDITEIDATYLSATTSFILTADEGISWTATTIPSWISLSTTAGTEGTTQITATISKNVSYAQRSGSIIFTGSNGDTAEIECTQEKHPLLVPVNNIYREGRIIN